MTRTGRQSGPRNHLSEEGKGPEVSLARPHDTEVRDRRWSGVTDRTGIPSSYTTPGWTGDTSDSIDTVGIVWGP